LFSDLYKKNKKYRDRKERARSGKKAPEIKKKVNKNKINLKKFETL
jgi:hypothetical protein